MTTLKREYTLDRAAVQPIRFFCRGDPYQFWGLFESDLHLFCPARDGTLFLLGTDRLGRDVLSRIIYGARVSLTIGLLGVAISFLLGLVFGGLAGYYGGVVDLVIQRIIEVLQSLPTIPLWLALAAIMPVTWSPMVVYFAITVILGLIDWTGLARAVRSKLLSLREEDYVLAAQLMGASSARIIGRHLVPGFMSHLIASATLAISGMILGETALSFSACTRPPITSWGVLLTEAQNINVVALYPWLLTPAIPVILVVLAFNFLVTDFATLPTLTSDNTPWLLFVEIFQLTIVRVSQRMVAGACGGNEAVPGRVTRNSGRSERSQRPISCYDVTTRACSCIAMTRSDSAICAAAGRLRTPLWSDLKGFRF